HKQIQGDYQGSGPIGSFDRQAFLRSDQGVAPAGSVSASRGGTQPGARGSLTESHIQEQGRTVRGAHEAGVPTDRTAEAGIRGAASADPNLTAQRDPENSGRMQIMRGDREVWSGQVDGKTGPQMVSQFENAGNAVLRDVRKEGTATGRPLTSDRVNDGIVNSINADTRSFQAEQGQIRARPGDTRG
ncbi:MAG TPA: hypothetical protein VLC93_11430, partial [Myxococcota bacterium]|nr:hypothetical protein [Myxococcota bacterium]